MFQLNRCLTGITAAAVSLLLFTGCDRRTPEERLTAATEFYQQGDQLSAEMEARKVLEKAPDDPLAIQANVLLAQIYASQNRFEEAEIELESALENVSQLEPMGKEILKMYLALLGSQEKYDKAIETMDAYQKEYAEDAGTSLSLRVAGADIRTAAGRTTESRQIISSIMAETTAPAEMTIYRDLYVRTFLRDEDTTKAIEYLESQMAQVQDAEEKRGLKLNLSNLYAQAENYEKSRQYLEAVTAEFTQTLRAELDNTARVSQSLNLGQAYVQLGNLPGARRVYQTLYDANVSNAQLAAPIVMGLAETLLRLGETSATLGFLGDAAKRYPSMPFAQQSQQLKDIIAKGQLEAVAPEDTAPLTLKYRADANVLWPAELPEILGVETTGTETSAGGSTGTETAASAPDAGTTEAVSNEAPAAPAAAVAPAAPAVPVQEVAPSPAAEAAAPAAPAQDTAPAAPAQDTAPAAPAAPAVESAPAAPAAPAPTEAAEGTTATAS